MGPKGMQPSLRKTLKTSAGRPLFRSGAGVMPGASPAIDRPAPRPFDEKKQQAHQHAKIRPVSRVTLFPEDGMEFIHGVVGGGVKNPV